MTGDCPLMCLVDDVHWLDRASAQVLGFTARRLAADPVGLVFAARGRGGDTLLEVYERPAAGEARHALASREVSDLRAAVDQLRDRGVRFEEYDLPEVKTEDGISASGDLREAWFRDPDGNILRIHSHIET